MANDHQLLNTARDYFQFVTNFFEVINVSATHIYHSALELSPLSSIIRKFYYYQRPHPSPRVVIGIPDSWDPSTAVSTKHSYYLSSTWSPCSQFVAVVAREAVEIWDALTIKLLSTLQPTKVITRFRHGLTYSPDGHSLAGCSDTAIVIWDTQTGGEVTKIECESGNGLQLVWSLDGKTIGTISQILGTLTVNIFNVATGTTLSSGTLQSRNQPYIWAHDKFFRIATTTAWGHRGFRMNIFKANPTLTKIESFPLQFGSNPGAFSPATYRIAVPITGDYNHDPKLLILDIQDSGVLLQETGSYWHLTFSPDGSTFAAFIGDHLPIWRYTSGHYTQWREFQQTPTPLQFSPTSSSILGCAGALLHIIHMDYSPTAPTIESVITTANTPRDAYSPHGTYIATTHCGKSAIMITNLHSQNPSPSQFIDTGLEISEIVLTGNVLLAKGSNRVMAWLLTEEGVVDGILDNRRADHNDSLWDISLGDTNPQSTLRDKIPSFWSRLLGQDHDKHNSDEELAIQAGDGHLAFSVGDGIAAVGYRNGFQICTYHTGTGEVIKPGEAHLHPKQTWYLFQNPHRDDCDFYHHGLRKHHKPPKCDWPVSQTTLQEGWVKDAEGKHQLWLHARWRTIGNSIDWFDEVAVLRLKNSSELVIIKF